MRHRLGEFTPLRSDRQDGGRSAPDLLPVLRAHPGRDAWLLAAYDALRDLCRGRPRLVLERCVRDPGPGGYTAIAVRDEALTAPVREGDDVVAGCAALRDPDGRLSVFPRIYRKVRDTGAVALSRVGADVLGAGGEVGDALARCLAPATAWAAVEQLREAARTPLLEAADLLRRADLPVPVDEVTAAREEDDDTVLGALDGLTALARRSRDFRRRLQLERGAERVLAVAGIAQRGDPPAFEAWVHLPGGATSTGARP